MALQCTCMQTIVTPQLNYNYVVVSIRIYKVTEAIELSWPLRADLLKSVSSALLFYRPLRPIIS